MCGTQFDLYEKKRKKRNKEMVGRPKGKERKEGQKGGERIET